MGTIVERPRKDGTTAYMAKIILKRDGEVIHRETETFDRRPAARAWIERREKELEKPGEIERSKAPRIKLAQAIDKYIAESLKEIGRTKAQVLRTIKADYDIAGMWCDEITSQDIVALATALNRKVTPQTAGNYISHLAAIFAIARPAWGYPLNEKEMEDAQTVARRLGLISKSKHRDRRPTLGELDKLMNHFADRQKRRQASAPMVRLIAFAIFSTRRQEEITRIAWSDLDEAHSRVLVRDMKNPGEKVGNDVWCDLPPEALAIVKAMPRTGKRIFPYGADGISAAFTRACYFLNINDEEMPDEKRLIFHDLRHDGVSRLFELGWNIPHVAAVSGHRSWTSLKRYTHLRQTGDKYAGWKWLPIVTAPMK